MVSGLQKCWVISISLPPSIYAYKYSYIFLRKGQ